MLIRPNREKLVDILEEVFESIRVIKASYLVHEVKAPWSIKARCRGDVRFILVFENRCWIRTKKSPEGIQLSSGDMFLLFSDDDYVLSDEQERLPTEFKNLCLHEQGGNRLKYGGDGDAALVITGFFNLDYNLDLLIKILPSEMHLPVCRVRCRAFRSIFELMMVESENHLIGSQAIVDRLCEIFFVYALRSYSIDFRDSLSGWLAASLDENLKDVMIGIHQDIGYKWTVGTMAEKAGMSRSAFASRFKLVVGSSPLEYLTRWRVHKAGLLFQKNNMSIAEVAHSVGYESESAFSKVFKEACGVTPGEFKRNYKKGKVATEELLLVEPDVPVF